MNILKFVLNNAETQLLHLVVTFGLILLLIIIALLMASCVIAMFKRS